MYSVGVGSGLDGDGENLLTRWPRNAKKLAGTGLLKSTSVMGASERKG